MWIRGLVFIFLLSHLSLCMKTQHKVGKLVLIFFFYSNFQTMRFLWDSDLELWYYFSNCRVILLNCNICTSPFVDNNVKVAVIYLLIFCFKPYYVSFRLLIRNFIPIFFPIMLTYRRLLKVILHTQIRLMIQYATLGHDPLKWHLLALDLGSFSQKVNL